MERLPQEGDVILAWWETRGRKVAREAFERVARDLGETPRALKAAITARGQLEGGLTKVLGKAEA